MQLSLCLLNKLRVIIACVFVQLILIMILTRQWILQLVLIQRRQVLIA